jgi:hypothetical protein
MRKIIFIVCMIPLTAFAEGPQKFEIQASPSIGWSSFSGFSVGIDGKFRYGLSSHWQMEFGLGYYAEKHRSLKDYSIGANYNFNEDWSRSWYLGAGMGVLDGEYVNYGSKGSYQETHLYTYLRGGRRFRLNDSGSITWSPYIQTIIGEPSAELQIMPLSFTFSF